MIRSMCLKYAYTFFLSFFAAVFISDIEMFCVSSLKTAIIIIIIFIAVHARLFFCEFLWFRRLTVSVKMKTKKNDNWNIIFYVVVKLYDRVDVRDTSWTMIATIYFLKWRRAMFSSTCTFIVPLAVSPFVRCQVHCQVENVVIAWLKKNHKIYKNQTNKTNTGRIKSLLLYRIERGCCTALECI